MVRELQSSIIEKSVAVIDLLTRSSGNLSYSDIVSGTGLNKSSAHRVLYILIGEELIQFNEKDKSYSVGKKLVNWARAAWQKTDLEQLSDQDLIDLSKSTGMNAAVSILSERTIMFIRTHIIHPHKLSPKIGAQSDLHCTAAGKVFLAYMDAASLEDYLKNAELEKNTETTITTRSALLKDIKSVRSRGYAIADREEFWQVTGIAVPIFSYDKRAIATLSLWTPTKFSSLGELLNRAPELMNVASEISARLSDIAQ